MRTSARILCFIIVVSLNSCSGCGIKGSGVKKEEVRDVDPFTELAVSGAMQIDVTIGPAQKLVISGDDNLVPLVTTTVSDGKLILDTRDNFRTDIGLKATITVESLTALEVSGACRGSVAGIRGDAFGVDISGASNVTLTGQVGKLALEVDGAAKIGAGGLIAADVTIDSSGASTIECHADKTLTADVSGAGRVRYTGDPAVTKDISGAASIKKLQ